MSSSDASDSDFFFSSFAAGLPAAAATGAGAAATGAAAAGAEPTLHIRSPILRPSSALAKRIGQNGSTWTLAAATSLVIFSLVICTSSSCKIIKTLDFIVFTSKNMGCDGGTIPKRHELIKTAKRPAQKDKDMDRNAKWSSCTISQQGLLQPIMSCELGKLYSKESVLEFLLDRSISDNATHIRSMKDVKELKLTKNSGYKKPLLELADQYHETQSSEYVCPVVGIEMNGKYKFCVLWTCGCVLSERALKEIDTFSCHSCGIKFTKDDIVVINPEDTDILMNESNMIKRRDLAKLVRKEMKDAKRKIDQATFKIPAVPLLKECSSSLIDSSQSVKRKKTDNKTVNTACKVQKSKEKISTEELLDAKKSKVYKSLFSSSEESKNRDKNKISNWVTYNPYHL